MDECITRKITATKNELGGKEGCEDVKKILNDVKQACNLEGAKCMMNLIASSKNSKTINLENIFNSEDNTEYNKYSHYTELSKSLQNIIDGI